MATMWKSKGNPKYWFGQLFLNLSLGWIMCGVCPHSPILWQPGLVSRTCTNGPLHSGRINLTTCMSPAFKMKRFSVGATGIFNLNGQVFYSVESFIPKILMVYTSLMQLCGGMLSAVSRGVSISLCLIPKTPSILPLPPSTPQRFPTQKNWWNGRPRAAPDSVWWWLNINS